MGLTPRGFYLLSCRPHGWTGVAGRRATRLAASGEPTFPFGERFRDKLHNMLPVPERTWVAKAHVRARVWLGYVHSRLVLQGLDSAVSSHGQWECAVFGPEKAAFELRLMRQGCSVSAVVRSLADRYERACVVFRNLSSGAETAQGEQDTAISACRTPASGRFALVALGEPDNVSRHLTLAVGQMPALRLGKRGGASFLKHFHSGHLADSTGEARTTASGRVSRPPRYRHKRDLSVYLKKAQRQLWSR